MNITGKRIVKVLTLTVIGATVLAALYIMANGLGLQDSLDFGAGAYYYADIPEFDRTVLADIVCAFGNTVQIGDLFEQSPADVFVVHAVTSAHYRLFRTYGGRTGGIPQLAADLVERTVDLRQDLVRCAAPR